LSARPAHACPAAAAHPCAAHPAPRRHSTATCATSGDSGVSLEDQEIQGLNREYCDDFECKSSPAVESTVRALARDISRANGVYTRSLLSRNVEYQVRDSGSGSDGGSGGSSLLPREHQHANKKIMRSFAANRPLTPAIDGALTPARRSPPQDAFRRFKGPGGYASLNFVTKAMSGASAAVTSMRMVDGATAEIRWRLRGGLGPLTVDVDMTTTVTLNLLTGQVERHVDSWATPRCSPPAAAAWTLARAAWAARRGAADAAGAANAALDSLSSMDASDGEGPGFSSDPNDPMKFFQQKDGFKDDAIMFVGGVALLYAVVQAYTTLFTS
jgi:hypothetical protein